MRKSNHPPGVAANMADDPRRTASCSLSPLGMHQRATELNHGVRPPYPSNETVLDQLHRHVLCTPLALALIVPEGDSEQRNRLELSYAQTWALVSDVASVIRAARARDRSDWVILVLPQGLQQVITVWAILHSCCGCALLPIPTLEFP